MVESGSLESFWACKRPLGSNPSPSLSYSSPVGFFSFSLLLSLAFSFSFWYYLLEREERQSFMKRSLFCLDTLVIAVPIIVGSAALLPFVVFDFARTIVREECARRGK